MGLGMALMGFAKLTLGELNAFTLGFVEKNKTLVGSEVATEFNVIRIRDYSTMYSSPNGYFFYLMLLVNLIGVRLFSNKNKTKKTIDTKLPSRAEFKIDKNTKKNKRRGSIDEKDLDGIDHSKDDFNRKSNSDIEANLGKVDSDRELGLESSRKFELFEKEFSLHSNENLSQADSNTTNIKSSTSKSFLEGFHKVQRPSSIINILLRFQMNPLDLEKKNPELLFFWMIKYPSYKKLTNIVILYVAASLYFSGNAFLTDLVFGFLLSKIYSRFYFKVLER
jgi:hypothetical protein